MKTPEEIKKGLEYCSGVSANCDICPYQCCNIAGRSPACDTEMEADALAYIRQLESKLAEYEKPLVPLTFEEAMEDDYYLERMGDRYVDVALNELALDGDLGFIVFDTHECEEVKLMRVDYGKTWRCWLRRPTDEERKAAKWDE